MKDLTFPPGMLWGLKDRVPAPWEGTMTEWSMWMFADDTNRRVALTQTPLGVVSTVYMGTGVPTLVDDGLSLRPYFETMVFLNGGDGGSDEERYETWAEAEAGHWAAVERLGGKAVCININDPRPIWEQAGDE